MGQANGGPARQEVVDAIRSALPNREEIELPAERAAELMAVYRDNPAHYRDHIRRSLAEDDYRQAAEKSWGAFAQAVKTTAAVHGLHIPSHRGILQVSQRLSTLAAQSNPDDAATLTGGLAFARSLHSHFYENDLADETVVAFADGAAKAVSVLEELFIAE